MNCPPVAPELPIALELLSLCQMARRSRLTQKWLREAADAGTIPCLRAGRKYLFAPQPVLEILVGLATETRNGKPKESAGNGKVAVE
jgi:hypothetical protein